MMCIKDKLQLLMLALLVVCSATPTLASQSLTVAPPENGSVTVQPLEPVAGDLVTVTVTPADGYCIKKSNIQVEVTVPVPFAQAPAKAAAGPQVGSFIELDGDEPDDTTVETSYSFVMPDEPYGVLITARFVQSGVTGIDDASIAKQVTATHYVNLSGQVSVQPFDGHNIVVRTFSDGTTEVSRQVR